MQHNWNQIHKLLLDRLAYTQIISYDSGIISYRSPAGRKIVIKKQNKISQEYVFWILLHIGFDYDAFVKFIKNQTS